jgi:hypothetical protein
MKTSLLPLPILALSLAAAVQARAEFNPSVVSADARWVAYADLNALRQNPVGKEVIDMIQQQSAHGLALPGASLTIDVPKLLATIGAVTAYGANFEKNGKQVDGTLVVEGTPDLRKIVEAVLLEMEVGNDAVVHDVKGLGYSAYALDAKDKAHPERSHRVIIAFPPQGPVVVSQSEDKVRHAVDLAEGRGESLAQAKGSDLGGLIGNAGHAILFGASVVPPEAVSAAASGHPGPHTRILEMTHSASIAIGDSEGKTFAHVQMVAANDDSADKLIKILQGMTAMISLAQSDNQKLMDFINSAQATRDGDRVSFQLAYDSGQLAEMVKGILASHAGGAFRAQMEFGHGGHGTNANVERILGKHVAGWKIEAAPGAAGTPEPIWRDIAGVRLTNGARISVHVSGSDGKAVTHFEAVQMKPADAGAGLLNFSRKMMTEMGRPMLPSSGKGSRLLQLAFPGEDGTYTLRVRFTRPAEGDVHIDVWVKNASDSDSRSSAAPQS